MCLMPIGDDNSDRRSTPIVNYVFIGINIFVFVFLQGMGANDKFTMAFSTVPAEIVSGEDKVTEPEQVVDPQTGKLIVDPETRQPYLRPGLEHTPVSVYLTLLTSMFMHGSFAHIFGNMLYLWIFGDNVEDDLGRPRYLVFYLTCGVLASLTHVFLNMSSLVPSLGASGAISGVLGGYMFLHPKRRVKVILMRMLTEVPAWVAIGLWFAYQLVLGAMDQGGGVAYGAHIGGFIAGVALIPLFMIGRRRTDSAAPPGAYTQRPTGRGEFDF